MTTPQQWVAQFMATAPAHADTIEALTSSTDWEDFCWIAEAILKSDVVTEAGLPADQVSVSRVVDSSMVIDSLYLDVYAPTLKAYLLVFIAVEDISTAPRESTSADAAVGYADVVMTKLAELGAAYHRAEPPDIPAEEQRYRVEPPEETPDQPLSPAETAERLGITKAGVDRDIAAGRLTLDAAGLVPRAELDRYWSARMLDMAATYADDIEAELNPVEDATST